MRTTISLTIILAAFLLGASILFVHAPRSEAATAGKLTGYAWSDTIGWIDMNCANTNSCGTNNFGISVDSSGNLSGYAWSDNIGWISANSTDLAGCPSGTCKAKIDSSTNKITGWLRALSGDGATTASRPVTVYLTSGSSWTVPADWNSSNNTIQVIGGGGGGGGGSWSGDPSGGRGGDGSASSVSGTFGTITASGGAGGAGVSGTGASGVDSVTVSRSSVALTPGDSLTITIGGGGGGGGGGGIAGTGPNGGNGSAGAAAGGAAGTGAAVCSWSGSGHSGPAGSGGGGGVSSGGGGGGGSAADDGSSGCAAGFGATAGTLSIGGTGGVTGGYASWGRPAAIGGAAPGHGGSGGAYGGGGGGGGGPGEVIITYTPIVNANNGWDGWISLSGASPAYGPTFSNSTGAITGYAWGSDVVGWVDFSLVTSDYRNCVAGTTYACTDSTNLQATTLDSSCNATYANTTCSYICSAGACVPPPAPQFVGGGTGNGHLKVAPSVVRSGSKTRVFWDVLYVASCTVSGGGDSWSGAAAGCNSSTHECTSGGSGVQSSAITTRRTYTLTCTGLDNSTINETATVNLVPTYQEI